MYGKQFYVFAFPDKCRGFSIVVTGPDERRKRPVERPCGQISFNYIRKKATRNTVVIRLKAFDYLFTVVQPAFARLTVGALSKSFICLGDYAGGDGASKSSPSPVVRVDARAGGGGREEGLTF